MSFLAELKRRNVVRIAIAYLAGSWLLIQILETLFPIFGLAETSIQVVVIALAIGFIPALIASWLFELTPQGIRRDTDIDRKSAAAGTKTLDRIIILMLTLALGYFAVDKFILDPARDAEREAQIAQDARDQALAGSYSGSIAVLPFDNLSSDPEQDYFARGIAADMLTLLAKIPELRVISRASSFQLAGQGLSMQEIAEMLDVETILGGAVRTSGDKIRINVQLIDGRTDTNLWSEIFNSELGDVFAIQDEVSAKVVEQLQIAILGELPRAEEIDPQAYSLFLRGRDIVHEGHWERHPLAEEYLTEALEIEPDYVPALTELGRLYLNSGSDENRSDEDYIRLARDVVDRISATAPGSAPDLIWRGYMAYAYDNDMKAAAPLFEQALKLDSNNPALYRGVVQFLLQLGYIDEGIIAAEYTVSRDPACVLCLNHLSTAYRAAGEPGKAVDKLKEAIEWAPDRGLIYWSLGSALLLDGRPAEALEAFEKEESQGGVNIARAMALHDLGRIEEFENEFALYRAENAEEAEGVARVYAWIGDYDSTIEWLEKLVEQKGPAELQALYNGFYSKIKADPRFDEFLRKYGQHPDQLEPISFEFTPPGS